MEFRALFALLTVGCCVEAFQFQQSFRAPLSRPLNAYKENDGAGNKDIVIIGGGLAGLSTALYVSQLDPTRSITILERDNPLHKQKTAVASFAAAGMLAPQSERLPSGPLLDLCLASRALYPDFVSMVESLATSTDEGKKYLTYGDGTVGYMAKYGFIAPAFAGDTVATWAPPPGSGSAVWLDRDQVRELEPNLHPNVAGGWWFHDDASVDARRLTCSLRAACVANGVQIQSGMEVTSLDLVTGYCKGVITHDGTYITTKSVVVANGAWMRNLLPTIPIEPHKGQSLSLRMPSDQPPLLQRTLFAQDTYICPKSDGRIVIGATVEVGSFDANVTPAGMIHVLQHALELLPGIKDLPIEETWAGLRPTTPDKGPILGKSPWENVFIAGGYWRNGVLLAPKTGQLLASLITKSPLSTSDEALLTAFSWDRFTNPAFATTLAANTRYAASMHPVQRRSELLGVGMELGSYSNARNARDERQKDRAALFQDGDDALEQAAQSGIKDGAAYNVGGVNRATNRNEEEQLEEWTANKDVDNAALVGIDKPQEASLSAEEILTGSSYFAPLQASKMGGAYSVKQSTSTKLDISSPSVGKVTNAWSGNQYIPSLQKSTMGNAENEKDDTTDLNELYAKIQNNKAASVEMGKSEVEERPDPGFRIYFVDNDDERHEVPPFTTPEEMMELVAAKKGRHAVATESPPPTPEDYNEQTFDGYTTIQQANARSSRQEELNAMKEARRMNRFGGSDTVDESKIGALRASL